MGKQFPSINKKENTNHSPKAIEERVGLYTRSRVHIEMEFFKSPEKPRSNTHGLGHRYQSPGKKHPSLVPEESPGGTTRLRNSSDNKLTSPVQLSKMKAARSLSFVKDKRQSLIYPDLLKTESEQLYYRRLQTEGLSIFSPRAPVTECITTNKKITGYYERSFSVEGINARSIEFMQRYIRYHGSRYPEAKRILNNQSADETALEHGVIIPEGIKLEFCHISASSLGGLEPKFLIEANKGNYKKRRIEYTPQDPNNFFVGTEGCNTCMIPVEDMMKKAIGQGKASSFNLSGKVRYLIIEDKKTIIADRLLYNVLGFKEGNLQSSLSQSFEFNPLSLEKPIYSVKKPLYDHCIAKLGA